MLTNPFMLLLVLIGLLLFCIAYHSFAKKDFRILGSLVGCLGLLFVAAGGNLGIPVVLNNTQLGWLSATQTLPVWRLGFSAPGDSGGPLLYTASNSPCSISTGAGDGGSQVPTSDGKCWLADLTGIRATPQIWGARGDGANDDTSSIQAAVTSVSDVYLPAGTYKVTNMITVPTGRAIRGAGRTQSIISVPATFNMSALGVVRMGTAEPGATMLDIGIEFAQPDVAVKASMVAYPPAIYAVAAPRFILDRIRISGAWDGIKATGNSGGAYIGLIEVSAINKGVEMGGSLDFFHGGHWHFGPLFGFTTTNRLAAWAAAGTTAVTTTGMDGLEIASITTFQGKLDFLATTATLPVQIGRVSLDGTGSGLTDTNFSLLIGTLYTTKDTGSVTPSITAGTGSNIIIGVLDQSVATSSDDIVVNSASARLVINSGDSLQSSLGYSAFAVSDGILELHNIRMKHQPTGTRTMATVKQTGGALRMSGNQWSGKNAVVGPALTVGGDAALNFIAGNDFVDWPVTFPATIASGEYGPNKITTFTAVPTVSFATNGNFVPSYTDRAMAYEFLGAGVVWFEGYILFNTNAYTTAAGAFQYVTGLPAAPTRDTAVTISDLANVTFGAGILSGAVIGTDSKVLLREITSNAALGSMGTAHIPPSKTGVLIRVSGTYRYR